MTLCPLAIGWMPVLFYCVWTWSTRAIRAERERGYIGVRAEWRM